MPTPDGGRPDKLWGGDAQPIVRAPRAQDASAIWKVVSTAAELDENSWYCYLLLCTHFSQTCAVAVQAGELVGFVTGFRPDDEPEALFVWQLWVDGHARQRGLAGRLLENVIDRQIGSIRRVYATVDPANVTSLRFFSRFAARLDGAITVRTYLSSGDFPQGNASHPPEDLVTITMGSL